MATIRDTENLSSLVINRVPSEDVYNSMVQNNQVNPNELYFVEGVSTVRSVSTGSSNGTVSVNTDGTSADVSVKGLKSAAFTDSTDYIASSLKGANNGVAELDSSGHVPAAQLPSYVDDVLEYAQRSSFPSTGESGKIYIDKATNISYRWSGSAYVEISSSLALGTTSSTAFRGDYGQSAYTHAVTNKGSAFTSGLYKITTNSEGHVTAAAAVVKSDITSLGIPGSDTTYTNADFGQGYGTCSTAAATANKIVNLSGYKRVTGAIFSVKFTYGAPADATLNVNNTGAVPIYYQGSAIGTGVITDGDFVTFVFSGAYYHIVAFDKIRLGRVGQGICLCETEANVSAKTAITNDGFELTVGGFLVVVFLNDVGRNATLNINGTGAKPIYFKGSSIQSGVIKAGDITVMMYDGYEYGLLAIDNLIEYRDSIDEVCSVISAGDGTNSVVIGKSDSSEYSNILIDSVVASGSKTVASGDMCVCSYSGFTADANSKSLTYSGFIYPDYLEQYLDYSKPYVFLSLTNPPTKSTQIVSINKTTKVITLSSALSTNAITSSDTIYFFETTQAIGDNSKAINKGAVSFGDSSIASGVSCAAVGSNSHAEGMENVTLNAYSHAEGFRTIANGNMSHAEGENTISSKTAQHASGKFNIKDTGSGSYGTYVEIVGNGTDASNRSNARTLDWNGNEWVAGKVSAGTVANPASVTADNDLTTKKYVDDLTSSSVSAITTASLGVGYGSCTTAAATAAKTVSITDYKLVTGGHVTVFFRDNVPADATLNINSTGAKPIWSRNSQGLIGFIESGVINAGDIATFVYNGSAYTLLSIDKNVVAYELKSNKVTSLSASSTDDQYASAKCVYDIIGNIEEALAALR